jgi:DNA modification methylase
MLGRDFQNCMCGSPRCYLERAGYNSKDLKDRFVEHARIVSADAEQADFSASDLDVQVGDTREALRALKKSSYDLVVTSPPYLNSFDYSDVYRPELFVGGFVSSNVDLRRVRLKTIRSHVQVKWEVSDTVASDLLPPILDRVRSSTLWNPRLPKMIQAYFADMQVVLRRCARVVKSSGQAWIVVSTSAYGGVPIPVDLILADIATHCGWSLRGVYVLRQMRSAGQQWGALRPGVVPPLRESLIILDRE